MNNYTSITDRTKIFAIRIIKAYGWLKTQNEECRVIGHQLLRSSISIGANVRESRAGQSNKDFLSKLEISLKEAIETQFHLELLIESELVPQKRFQPLLDEAIEIGKILTASTKKIKEKLKN